MLDAGGLLPHFAAVYGADKAALRKPAPAMLNRAAQELGLPTQQLLMVGDSAADMGSAAAAGSPAVWAGWGYGALHSLPIAAALAACSGPISCSPSWPSRAEGRAPTGAPCR